MQLHHVVNVVKIILQTNKCREWSRCSWSAVGHPPYRWSRSFQIKWWNGELAIMTRRNILVHPTVASVVEWYNTSLPMKWSGFDSRPMQETFCHFLFLCAPLFMFLCVCEFASVRKLVECAPLLYIVCACVFLGACVPVLLCACGAYVLMCFCACVLVYAPSWYVCVL